MSQNETKKPARVQVISAKDLANILPSGICKLANLHNIKVQLCGDSETDEQKGWAGYVASSPRRGESQDAYESAEDCAEAALLNMAQDIALDLGFTLVKKA
jgi:hypothetical protein